MRKQNLDAVDIVAAAQVYHTGSTCLRIQIQPDKEACSHISESFYLAESRRRSLWRSLPATLGPDPVIEPSATMEQPG